ncbi:involucrin repeat protein [Talaromyces stipitatus ATCC 10500]|uniref:Involucrin repeat protein n=1 Tax=Talaromyces stipitatus (strain ATCC 10500 / CBS 375.48 / QM 6759 / NRRL 1006) TaxID=441959 RepID=B8LVY3_TALSN|nr:involucrin repeat protein [Talaromyces stipitatus ATCC 10500]EED24349.1 involucrin repeat protein [Talaromyces stipitatus ATCC 10500]
MDSLRSSTSSYGDPRYLSTGYPNGAVSVVPSRLVDGYRSASDMATDDRSQYSGHSGPIPQTNAPSIDIQDPVLLHLLTETAIGDSAGYEILPFEEVEDLKREYATLSNRVEGTKRKLALETKLRDAAQSLRRLSSLKSNGVTNGVAHHPEDEEFTISSRKCEELAQELWALERRAQDVHKRLLEHTAGILQLTHRGLKKNANRGSINNGLNGTTLDFDDRSLYREMETDDPGLRSQNGGGGLAADINSLRSTEQKLEELNGRLRDLLLDNHSPQDIGPLPLRVTEDTSLTFVQDHLAYLERSLETLQSSGLRRGGLEPEISATEMGSELGAINSQLRSLLGQAGSHLSPTLPPPPSPTGEYLSNHMDYLKSGMEDLQRRVNSLQDQKSILTTQIQQQRELNSKSDAEKDAHVADLAQQLVETRKQRELSERELETVKDELALVMEQLDTVRQQENIQDSQREREQIAALQYEKEARSKAETEVQRLQNELTRLEGEYAREQTAALEQEREARSKAETEVQRIGAELFQIQAEYARAQSTETEAQRLREELTQLEGEYARAQSAEIEAQRLREELTQLEGEYARVQSAEIEAQRLREELTQLEGEYARAQSAEIEAQRLREELTQLEGEYARAQSAEIEAQRLREELTQLEGEYARAQTELTVVKAELDGAYGTRAERAAEAAASPALYKEIEDLNTKNISLAEELATLRAERVNTGADQGELQKRVETLQKELEETIEDYEAMTKASIEFEKERERYEGTIDNLRDRIEQLEAQLSDERITWMGVSQTAMRDGATETTSTMVLKNEFKKMMRDTRAENMKLLRAEQEERKKLEALVRSLKMEQTIGKPTLNQSMVT